MKKTIAAYRLIAIDLAKRIMNHEIPSGAKLSGRTMLASQYGVSPETIRKAMSILKEANVIAVSQGKEITVISAIQAGHFVEHTKEMVSAYSLRQDLEILLAKKEENDQKFRNIVTQIMQYSDRLKNLTPFNPVELWIKSNSMAVGKTLEELRLWHNTGATVVAIRRENQIIVSPGPYALLQAEDRIVVVGTNDVMEKVTAFVNPKDK